MRTFADRVGIACFAAFGLGIALYLASQLEFLEFLELPGDILMGVGILCLVLNRLLALRANHTRSAS